MSSSPPNPVSSGTRWRSATGLAVVLIAGPMLLAPPAKAFVEPSTDVAWLADALHVRPSELPASVSFEHFRVLDGMVTEWITATPIEQAATLMRGVADEPRAVPQGLFLGAGVRSTAAGTRGVGWSGSAYSPVGTPCMTFAPLATGPTVPPNPVNAGGNVTLVIQMQLPATDIFRAGAATMDVQVLPAPGAATSVPAFGAQSDLLDGSGWTSCLQIFTTLVFTAGGFTGDGTIHSIVP